MSQYLNVSFISVVFLYQIKKSTKTDIPLPITTLATTRTPTADGFIISNFSRDLPNVVRQLSQEAPQISDKSKRFGPDKSKRFGPSSVPIDSFPVSMSVPLVAPWSRIPKEPTPRANSVIISSTSKKSILPSKLGNLVFLDGKARRNYSSQHISEEEVRIS